MLAHAYFTFALFGISVWAGFGHIQIGLKIRFPRVSVLRAISFRYRVEGYIKFRRTIPLASTSFITTISFYMDYSRWVRNMYYCMCIQKLRQHISRTSICSCVIFETIDCQVSCNRGDKGQFILSGGCSHYVTTSHVFARVTCLHTALPAVFELLAHSPSLCTVLHCN